MNKPNLSSIESLLSTGNKFALTENQYHKETSATMPKNFYYLKTNSAVAKLANRYGF